MKRILVVIFYLYNSIIFSQVITVLDAESKFPISNVAVFNENKSKQVITDKTGKVDISIFNDDEILSFTHIAYVEFEILKRKIPVDQKVYLNSGLQYLDEVFLSASKGKELRKRIAEQIDILSLKDIQQVSPQTSADMLAEIPGIKVQKTQLGGGSPILRGMEANRVLLVVDGIRMNNAIYRKGHLQNSITVSPTMLDRTEVIFGPSSVIYGSDALGGIIHYYTRKPMLSDMKRVNVSALSRYSSADNEFTSQATAEFSFKKAAFLTSISHSKFGDLNMGKNRVHGFDDWGKVYQYSNNSDTYYNSEGVPNPDPDIQKNTGYNQTDILQKTLFPLSEKTTLSFNLQYSTSSDIPRFDRLTEYRDGNLRYAEWYYGPQNRLLLSSQLDISPNKKWMQHGIVTLAYQNIDESRTNRSMGSFSRSVRKENVKVYSLNADFSLPLTLTDERIFSYGLELTHNKVTSEPKGEILRVEGNSILGVADTFAIQSRFADGGSTYSTFAAYLNYRQDIDKKSTLNTGIRFTNTILKATWIDDTFLTLPDNDIISNNSAINATISYVYKPRQNWQINMVASSGFRAPNVDDIGKVRERGGDVTVPNINLKPEYAYNGELGILKYFNERKLYAGLTTYYTLLDNYIIREPFVLNGETTIMFDGEQGNIVANVNKGKAYVYGGTFNLKGQIKEHYNARAFVTYTKGKTLDTKEPLSSIPPVFGLVEFSRDKGKLFTGINLKFNGMKKTKNFNLTEGLDRIEETPIINPDAEDLTKKHYGLPSWSTINFTSRYKATRNIDLIFNVDNILDKHYKEFASSISAPGRNFSITLLANF